MTRLDGDSQLSPHFWASEFWCPCGNCDGGSMKLMFIMKLEQVANEAGFPLIINSGFRCPEHNALVGGEPNSAHLIGNAADISIANGIQRSKLIELGFKFGLNGKGIPKDYVHLDNRDSEPDMWTYYK